MARRGEPEPPIARIPATPLRWNLTVLEPQLHKDEHQLGRLVGILSDDLADQLADVRRRLTTIEDRLESR